MEPEALQESIHAAPRRPGVYLMKDGEGKVIYVGKAKDLRARVRSYFGGTDGRRMIPFLVPRIEEMEFIVTETEKEALILENNLIKKHRPRYNVNLRDDKNFYSLRLDAAHPFPRFQLVRRIRKDGARYFGPYSSSTSMKETFRYLHRIFPLRTCRDLEFKTRKR
ncbi:MAG: GIY-YIG nuclease family protein, partial [Syntrophaceae bacterium]|nr:GIY-YIG nuclease family protein [Syntrophaceae bacterium]